MDSFLVWLKTFFSGFFRFRLFNYQRRLESKVRHNTVGKVQSKMHQGMRKIDQKVNKAQDKMLPGGKRKPSGPPTPATPAPEPPVDPSSTDNKP